METIHANIGRAIGNTPMVYLNNISKDLPAKIAVKLEYMNPTCSVKDRAAAAMIEEAEIKDRINPYTHVLVEATSGNMGVALAFYAKLKGYKIVLIVPETASTERRAVMLAFGAEVIITERSGSALVNMAEQVAASDPKFFFLNQFGNTHNINIHYRTTGPEIWRQTKGEVDIVVFGVGSGGTITGAGKYLKEKKPEVQIYAVEPDESAVLSGGDPGLHDIQGIGAGFVPPIVDRKQFTEIMRVKSADAVVMARRLATEESILGGISSGANVCAALEIAKKEENKGKLIVTTISSFGERYLSSILYEDIRNTAMTLPLHSVGESIEIARRLLPPPS